MTPPPGEKAGPKILERLTLRDNNGAPFLHRWGLHLGPVGIFLHSIPARDPGLDLHDHPWPFATLILWGGYTDEVEETRRAVERARTVADHPQLPCTPGRARTFRRGSIHRGRTHEAHRITSVEPHTWTLVVRGRREGDQAWGFYTPDGWVDWRDYDYAARRPSTW